MTTALEEILSWFKTPTLSSSQIPVIPFPGGSDASGLHKHLESNAEIHTQESYAFAHHLI